jgi:hypothetical protein
MLNLPHIYNVENSQQVAQELVKLRTTNKMKFITVDIKDLYVNLPVSGIIHITQFWLQKHNNHNKQLNDQILNIFCIIIKQNYFQYEHQICQQEKGNAIRSPISSTIAEIYLKYLENIYIKLWLDSKEILFYKRCVDDILIAYDQEKIDEQVILQRINGMDNNLQFKVTTEANNAINYFFFYWHYNPLWVCILQPSSGL